MLEALIKLSIYLNYDVCISDGLRALNPTDNYWILKYIVFLKSFDIELFWIVILLFGCSFELFWVRDLLETMVEGLDKFCIVALLGIVFSVLLPFYFPLIDGFNEG